MTKQVIYYKPQIGKATKDVLREISPQDQDYIKRVMDCYQQLAEADPREDFEIWFNKPTSRLPPLRDQGLGFNSPRTWCEGIIAKLNRAPGKRDLSPQQCRGIETLSKDISECYDDCPYIVFENKLHKTQSVIPPSFDKLFKRNKK